jgi:hypothetical protein
MSTYASFLQVNGGFNTVLTGRLQLNVLLKIFNSPSKTLQRF